MPQIGRIDYDGPLTDIETDNNVVVPETHIQLTDHQLQELQNRIDLLSDDGNSGINHFLDTVTVTVSLCSNEKHVSTSNQKYIHPSCDSNGSNRTYDHCHLSHELHKDEAIYCRYCFH